MKASQPDHVLIANPAEKLAWQTPTVEALQLADTREGLSALAPHIDFGGS
jgi:hypothetical protein